MNLEGFSGIYMAAGTEVSSWELHHSGGVCKTDTGRQPTRKNLPLMLWEADLPVCFFQGAGLQERLPESIKCNYSFCELRAGSTLNKAAEEFIATNTKAADSLALASASWNKSTPKQSGHSLDIIKPPTAVLLCKESSLFLQPDSFPSFKSFLLRFAVWCL